MEGEGRVKGNGWVRVSLVGWRRDEGGAEWCVRVLLLLLLVVVVVWCSVVRCGTVGGDQE